MNAPDAAPGVQIERTRLAWRRTSLSATGAALLGLGALVRAPSATTLVTGILMLAAWAAVLAVAQRRIAALDRSASSLSPDRPAVSPPAASPPTASLPAVSLPAASRLPATLGLLVAAIALLALSFSR